MTHDILYELILVPIKIEIYVKTISK